VSIVILLGKAYTYLRMDTRTFLVLTEELCDRIFLLSNMLDKEERDSYLLRRQEMFEAVYQLGYYYVRSFSEEYVILPLSNSSNVNGYIKGDTM
jgi:hypothetical protein